MISRRWQVLFLSTGSSSAPNLRSRVHGSRRSSSRSSRRSLSRDDRSNATLLISYGLTIPLLTLLPVLSGEAAIPAFAAGMILVLVGLLDAAFSSFCLRNIRVDLPSVVRMTKDRESTIELSITHSGMRRRTLRVGLPLFQEIPSPQEDLVAILPKGVEYLRILWPCIPLRRGQFHIHRVYVGTISFLGLWAFREPRTLHARSGFTPAWRRKGTAWPRSSSTGQLRHSCEAPARQGKRVRKTARIYPR